MTNIYYNQFTTDDEERNKELDFCLSQLCNNESIDNVYVLGMENPKHPKCKKVTVKLQPDFDFFFKTINIYTAKDDINIIINSDCYIEKQSIDLIKENLTHDKCYCLTRYDMNKSGELSFYDRIDSQDAWCFKGAIKKAEADFSMGMPGCDNALCYILDNAGYEVLNPSLDIKVIHLHLSLKRNYKMRVDLPYKLLKPTNL